jgi:hypothetical protein
MPGKIRIANHLILPFGTARKFDLNRIKLSSVAADGIYFTSDIPCIYINRAQQRPLTINDWRTVFGFGPKGPKTEDVVVALDFICNLVKSYIPEPTKYQISFLKHYFSRLKGQLPEEVPFEPVDQPFQLYNALLPVPEMQLYVNDPLEEDFTYEPTNNFRVDFGFWTGTALLAVEIDGNDPGGYARELRRDRLLRRANVDIIHILNTEIELHGERVIDALLPESVTEDWKKRPAPEFTHFSY